MLQHSSSGIVCKTNYIMCKQEGRDEEEEQEEDFVYRSG